MGDKEQDDDADDDYDKTMSTTAPCTLKQVMLKQSLKWCLN